ncbi:hypothetical protein F2Q70_00035591 [Brassica cretica]|uniref:Uncharacterized protein n=1 Tax=Brassica cretica TaxID=69181 RepID=A0A8S9JTQ2_BRACR|nr:hypothetical protein F2Q70_00035591 [Brassica cretica]
MSSLSFAVSTRTWDELGVNRPKTVKLSNGDCGIRGMDEITLFFIFSLHPLETHWEWFIGDDEIPQLVATSLPIMDLCEIEILLCN